MIDELALRGVLTNSSSNDSAKDSSAADAAGKAAAAAAGAEGGAPQAGSQGSDVLNVSDDTQVVLDCGSQTGPPEPAATAAGKQADQPTGAAAAAGAQKAARPPAAAAAANGKKAAAKLKGEALLWPASRPIITCAAVEQVSCLRALFLTSPHLPLCWFSSGTVCILVSVYCMCVCVPTHMVGWQSAKNPPTCAAPWCDMLCCAVPCCADADCQPGPWHPCLLLLGGCASEWQAGLWAAVQDEQDNEGVRPGWA